MGIPSYFSYIIKNHSKIIQNQEKIKIIDNLYLDSNSIIYDALANINFTTIKEYEKNIINLVIEKINNYVEIVKPLQTVFIAFDGVAPVAKLEQQRTRRYKSKFVEQLLDKNSPWDRSSITPGTKFMENLCKKLNKKYLKNNNIVVSGSDEVGEGEHKIFNYIRNNPEKHKNETTLIYGLDADLIMLSLCNSNFCKNIYIYRETPEFIKSIDYNFNPNELYCLDIKELSNSIIYEMTNKRPTFSSKNILYDYIFICFLLGNDFLPHFPSLNIRTHGINILMSAYYNTLGVKKKYIINDGTIKWGNFKLLINWIKENEKNNLLIEYELRDKFEKKNYSNKTIEDKLNIFPIKNREIEKYIEPTSRGWDYRYYKLLFESDPTNDFVKKVCINYLEGLEWVFKYYTKDCCDWRWKYKYHYPPLFKDLVEYIPNWETTMIDKNDNKPLEPLTQLSYVIPMQSLDLIPKKIVTKISNKIPEFYKDNFKIKWAFCKYFWEAHVDFTEIDINEFEKVLI
tara:strand:- start:3636 stop:5171 length:1536 start_codon:yes stop_codon:yes gene_type:complete